MEIDKKEINKLYIACRESFEEYYADLKQADDNKRFFVDALECEICANAISLCIELYCELIDSPGMETSCRSILEAMALRNMVFLNELDDEQLANFKHQSALLFYGNIFDTAQEERDRLYNDAESELLKKKIHWIVEDYERAMETYREKYGSDLDEKAARDAIRESLFFAAKNPSRLKSFTTIVNGHLRDFDKTGTMYQRISFFAHPWYVDSVDDVLAIRSERLKDVYTCLEALQGYFAARLAKVSDGMRGIEEDLSRSKDYLSNAQLIKNVCFHLHGMTKNPLSFTSLCYAFLKDLLAEMNILIGLGYHEIALSKFQVACEFWGMNALINNVENPTQLKSIHRMFDYSTRLHLRKVGSPVSRFANIPLKDAESIRAAFTLAPNDLRLSFEEYCRRIKADSRAFPCVFIPRERFSYMDFVRLPADLMFPVDHFYQKECFIIGYMFSIDVHHATGFCYTENRDCWATLSHGALYSIYDILIGFVSLFALFSGIAIGTIQPFLKALAGLMDSERRELNELDLKYPEEPV